MTLNLRGDLFTTTATTFKGAVASGTGLWSITNEPKIRQFTVSPTTLHFVASASLGGTTPQGVCLVAPASMAVCYSGGARVDIVDVNTLATTGITTNAPTTQARQNEQIDGLPSQQLACCATNTAGRVTFVSPTCCASINPTALSGAKANCVLARKDTNTWFLGTTDGKIHEINTSGTIVTTVTVPSSPFVASPTINVQSLSYSFTGAFPVVAAALDCGQTLFYNWTTKAQLPVAWPSPNTPILSPSILCPAVSGIMLASNNNSITPNLKGLSEIYFETGNPVIESTYFNETNVGILDAGLESTSGLFAWAIFNEGNFINLRVFGISAMNKVTVGTGTQQPLGNYIAARIMRIRYGNSFGSACVELDQTIGPGAVGLSCTEGKNYIEVALLGNIVNGNPPYTGWDVREFQG